MGWATWHNNNLVLTGIDKLKKHKWETVIPLPVHRCKKAQVAEFRGSIVILNINNQAKKVSKKLETVKNCGRAFGKVSRKEIKEVRKAGGLKEYEKAIDTCTNLSNKGFGKLFMLSKASGYRIQKRLNEYQIIKSQKRFVVVKEHCTLLEFDYVYRPLGYIYNRSTKQVLKQLSNKVTPQAIVGIQNV